jgi:outer membrane beta-barrel protein
MKRASFGLCAYLALAGAAWAQEQEASPPAGEEAAPPPAAEAPAEAPAAEPPAAEPPKEGEVKTPVEEVKPGTKLWQDIYVVPRRAVLKRRRLEIAPSYNVTLNNPVVRHHGFGGNLNLYLSEAFFIGLEGTYYVKDLTDRYFLLGLDDRVLPSANQYIFSALLQFGYVPIHGKFTLFNSNIFHWEVTIAAGVGVIETQVIPRDPANVALAFTNFDVLFAAELGSKLWLTRWLAVDAYIRDYIFPDILEPTNHGMGMGADTTADQAKSHGESTLVNNIVFGIGLSAFLPTGFDYKTLR